MRCSTTRLTTLLAGVALAAGASPAFAASTDGPDYEMPFVCGDTWTGSSRSSHSPSPYSIDFNRPDDLGALMVAAAPGVVTRVQDLGNRSYGRYIIVDHRNGSSTVYAHLQAFWTTQGQSVDQGTVIGQVGTSGGSTGPHLHYEQRLDGRVQRAYFHRTSFVMGSTQSSLNCPDVPQAGDWNGDGKAEPGVFRRVAVSKFWLRDQVTGKATRVDYGRPSDEPVTGDWNGDGTTDVGVRRPGWKAFLLRARNGTTTRVNLGRVKDVGVTGDWDGNGRTEVGIWNPGTRVFTQRFANGTTQNVALGSLGDRPVTGDWNGDKRTDLGVFRPSTAAFYLRTRTTTGTVKITGLRLGRSTDLPVTGDWDGNGTTDVGVWSPSTATYTLRTTPTAGRTTPTVTTARMGRVRG